MYISVHLFTVPLKVSSSQKMLACNPACNFELRDTEMSLGCVRRGYNSKKTRKKIV